MTDKGMRTALTRFTTDYGMIFVLILLGVLFSAVTFKDQNPTGAAAGEILAQDILDRHPGARVIILAATSNDGHAFVESLRRDLEAGGATVVQSVEGDVPDMGKALGALDAAGTPVDIIACTQKIAGYTLLLNRAEKFPSLAETEVVIPARHAWPDFLKASNLRAVANRIPVIAIIAIGMTLVIITAGIDLSVGSLIAFSAVLTTYLIREFGGATDASATTMILCSLIGAGACALLGAFTGSMVTFLGIPAFIATLSMMLGASGLAYIISNSESIYQLPESFTTLGRGTFLGIPNPVALTILLYAVAHIVMTRTVFGRYVYAVGGNPDAARLSGVPVRRVLLACYTICGALAGLGGVIRASELKSGAPTFGFMVELDVIAAVVVGGTSLLGGEGKILGTLIGALIIAVIRNGMNLLDVESNTQKVFLGLVILGAVVLDRLKKRV
jgi:ribose transport system permease protein